MSNILSKNSSLACFIVLFAFFIIYFPSLYLPFGWDDYYFLHQAHFIGTKIIPQSITSTYLFRPLTREIYWVIGEYFTFNNPFIYRLANITILLASCFIFFKLLINYLKFNVVASLLVISIFLSHPVGLGLLRWVSYNQDIIAVFFLYLSWYFLLNFTKTPGKKSYLLSLVAFSGVILSKEAYLCLPIVLLLYWLIFKKFPLKKILFYILPFCLLIFLYALNRKLYLLPFDGYASNGNLSEIIINLKSLFWKIVYSPPAYTNTKNSLIGLILLPIVSFFVLILNFRKIKPYREYLFILLFWGFSTLFIVLTRQRIWGEWYLAGFMMPFLASMLIFIKILFSNFHFKTVHKHIFFIFLIMISIMNARIFVIEKYLNRNNFCTKTNSVEQVACALNDVSNLLNRKGIKINNVLIQETNNLNYKKDGRFIFVDEYLKYLTDNKNLLITYRIIDNNISAKNYDLIISFNSSEQYEIGNNPYLK